MAMARPIRFGLLLMNSCEKKPYYTPGDSNQLRKLADDPNHEDVEKRMTALLEQWIEETGCI
jgi:hypothetical protein